MPIFYPRTEIIKTKIDNSSMKVKKILLHFSYKIRRNDIGKAGSEQIVRPSKYTDTFNCQAIIAVLRSKQERRSWLAKQ